jgi:multiple sugar transport system substrate-binding protein
MSATIQLRGCAWDHTRGFDPMVATAAAYQREHPNVEIQWERRSLHDFGHARVDELAANYDLVVLDHPWAGFIATTRCYLPLDKHMPPETLAELARQGVGPAHRSYEWDGHQWALAIDAATPSASYRPDLLTETGMNLPHSWPEVLELGRRCRARGRWIACPLNPVDSISIFLTVADNVGAQPFATHGQVVHHDAGQRVLNAMRDLAVLCPPDTFQLTPITMMDRMSRTDEIVYCPMAYSYSNYSRPGYRPHLCLYADMPALGNDGPRGSHIGGTGLAVSSRCKHPEAAVDYAARVASAEWQRTIYFDAGGQPGNALAWDDPHCNAAANNFFRNTRRTIDRAFLRPRYNGYIPFQYDGGDLIKQHLMHGSDPGKLLNDLDALYRKSLAT